MEDYRLCIAVYDSFLAELAGIIGAAYVPGSFDRAVEAMYDADLWDADWEMRGEQGSFHVYVEPPTASSSALCAVRGRATGPARS